VQPRLPEVKLGPRYRVVDEIAAGGMGSVVLALRTGPHGATPVAIKKLHAHLVDNAEVVTSFVDEARIASRIDHPNVVPVHDIEMIGNELMIVMDYVEGIALRELLRARTGGLPIPVVRRVLVDALDGLHAAHELTDEVGRPLDVVHRDVSPHNLLVGSNGFTRVTDFGIAMATGRIASTKPDGAVKGKLQYLSPEQVFREPIDRRTDVFAAGVVLWEALVGRKLFDAGTEGETLAMIIREPIAPPSTHRFELPLDLDESCLRALEREPARRFASAWDLARAIEDGGPLATREEVGALVLAQHGPMLLARRERLAATLSASVIPVAIEAADAPTVIHLGSPATKPDGRDGRTRIVTRDRQKPASAIPLMIVASVCVSTGLLVGFSVRATPKPSARSESAAPIATSAPVATAAVSPLSTSGETRFEITERPPIPIPAAPRSITTTSVKVASPATRRTPSHGDTRRADGGRSQPFMPDDL
jgi:eukaryotic-like serine/threonine-protein kinase